MTFPTLCKSSLAETFVHWKQAITQIYKHSRTHRTECEQGEVSQICLETKLQDGTTRSPGWNVHVSANHWYVNVGVRFIGYKPCWHFYKNISYHIHITCLWPDCHIWRRTRWWWSYRWEGFQASDSRDLRTNYSHVWGNKTRTVLTRSWEVFVVARTGVLGVFPNLNQVVIVPKPDQSTGTL